MRATTSVRVSCHIRFSGSVTRLAVAACQTPWYVAVLTGFMGGSPGRRGGRAALCTMVADFTLCSSSTPSQETPPPPRAPLCRSHYAQSQLARARAVRFLTGPHAHTPRTHSQWVPGPGRTPQGRAVGRGKAPNPGRPRPRQEAPPTPGALVPPPPARKASSQVRALWGW